eukprot:gene21634-28641_t
MSTKTGLVFFDNKDPTSPSYVSTKKRRTHCVCSATKLSHGSFDPTGSMSAAIQRQVLDAEPALGPGATVMLQQVSIFSPQRNILFAMITANNILQAFPAVRSNSRLPQGVYAHPERPVTIGRDTSAHGAGSSRPFPPPAPNTLLPPSPTMSWASNIGQFEDDPCKPAEDMAPPDLQATNLRMMKQAKAIGPLAGHGLGTHTGQASRISSPPSSSDFACIRREPADRVVGSQQALWNAPKADSVGGLGRDSGSDQVGVTTSGIIGRGFAGSSDAYGNRTGAWAADSQVGQEDVREPLGGLFNSSQAWFSGGSAGKGLEEKCQGSPSTGRNEKQIYPNASKPQTLRGAQPSTQPQHRQMLQHEPHTKQAVPVSQKPPWQKNEQQGPQAPPSQMPPPSARLSHLPSGGSQAKPIVRMPKLPPSSTPSGSLQDYESRREVLATVQNVPLSSGHEHKTSRSIPFKGTVPPPTASMSGTEGQSVGAESSRKRAKQSLLDMLMGEDEEMLELDDGLGF